MANSPKDEKWFLYYICFPFFHLTIQSLNRISYFTWAKFSSQFPQAKLFKTYTDEIHFTAKAYNGRVLLEWLSHEVYTASTIPEFAACDVRFHTIAAALTLELDMIMHVSIQYVNVCVWPITN